jgi:hypothetical protein
MLRAAAEGGDVFSHRAEDDGDVSDLDVLRAALDECAVRSSDDDCPEEGGDDESSDLDSSDDESHASDEDDTKLLELASDGSMGSQEGSTRTPTPEAEEPEWISFLSDQDVGRVEDSNTFHRCLMLKPRASTPARPAKSKKPVLSGTAAKVFSSRGRAGCSLRSLGVAQLGGC